MRFYDDVMRSSEIAPQIKALLDGCVVVACDNVASYYYEGTDKEYWDLSDFPNIAPPFGRFWLDFKAPKQCVSETRGVIPWAPFMPTYWGLHCQATQVDEASEMVKTEEGRALIKKNLLENSVELQKSLERACPQVYEIAQESEEYAREHLAPEHFTMLTQLMGMVELHERIEAGDWAGVEQQFNTEEGYKWSMDVTAFQKLPQGGKEVIAGPLWTWRLFITQEGQIAHDPLTKVPLSMSSPQGETRERLRELEGAGIDYEQAWQLQATGFSPFFHTGMLAISFMHCHNVSLDTVTPPKHIVRNKNARRRGEKDFQPMTFKTLDIKPMREVLTRAEHGAGAGERTTRALHICRGHFRHYQEGRGLFGKYSGTFWVGDHVRGASSQGIRVKEYNIKL